MRLLICTNNGSAVYWFSKWYWPYTIQGCPNSLKDYRYHLNWWQLVSRFLY